MNLTDNGVKDSYETEQPIGNFGFEARHWIGSRIMSKELFLRIEGKQTGGPNQPLSILGSVIHPVKGSIAEFLLEAGFAAYVDW